MTKIDVLIPARNEAPALPHLLEEIDRSPLRRILVVDNGSTDDTANIARNLGCAVVHCPRPGYGGACLAGIAYLRNDPPDVLVFLDGDRSDHPGHMPQIFGPIATGTHDFVLGSRTLGRAEQGSLTPVQRFGNILATKLMWLFWGASYSDLGPFRAISWQALQRLDMRDTNFGWTIEMQIKAHQHRLQTLEIPVNYRKRIGVSKISGTLAGVVKAGTKIIYTLIKYRLMPSPKGVLKGP